MPKLAIDCFHEELPLYSDEAVVVAVDVIRSTTTAVSCVASGRRCIVVPSLEEAERWRDRLEAPLLVGELGGNMPYGYDLNNSPVAIERQPDPERPAILLSSSGTKLMALAGARFGTTLVACLRNWTAQAAELLEVRPREVALVGAGTRGEFREEDQLCCAWIGARLVDAGYTPSREAAAVIGRWGNERVEAILSGRSATYLRDSGQLDDLRFILEHIDDLSGTFMVHDGEVVARRIVAGAPARPR
jgi:2-phosphosulfolactate phosphatase